MEFKVNYNELYNSDVSIKLGDFSITNCKLEDGSIRKIICYYEFPESSTGKSLNLIFDKKVTEYSINIEAPPYEFSVISRCLGIHIILVHLLKRFILKLILLIK